MENLKLLALHNSDIERMSIAQKQQYYERLRDYCYSIRTAKNNITFVQKLVAKMGPVLRNFDLEVRGIENVPTEGSIILCNHSNSHDAITTLETMTKLNLPASILVTNEGINKAIEYFFKLSNCTIINRSDTISTRNGMFEHANKLLNGETCIIFGEGTWNLHPIKPMQNLHLGAAKIAAITGKPIIPT